MVGTNRAVRLGEPKAGQEQLRHRPVAGQGGMVQRSTLVGILGLRFDVPSEKVKPVLTGFCGPLYPFLDMALEEEKGYSTIRCLMPSIEQFDATSNNSTPRQCPASKSSMLRRTVQRVTAAFPPH